MAAAIPANRRNPGDVPTTPRIASSIATMCRDSARRDGTMWDSSEAPRMRSQATTTPASALRAKDVPDGTGVPPAAKRQRGMNTLWHAIRAASPESGGYAI